MGSLRSQRGDGGSRGALGRRPLRLRGELHPTAGAVPLRHHIHGGRTGVRRAGEPGAGEERG